MNFPAILQMIRISFIDMLAYRVNYFTGILTYTVHIAVNSSILLAMQKANPHHVSFNASELLTFISVGYFLRSFTFSNLDMKMAGQIDDGSMVIDLIKPFDYPSQQMCRAAGAAIFRLFCFCVPIIIVNLYLFPIQTPKGDPLAFVISALIAFWIFAQFTFMIGLCAIYMTSISGLIRLKQLSLNLMMGLVIPLNMFPDFLRSALQFTPFPQVSYVPVMIYMGRLDELGHRSLSSILLLQFFWALITMLIARFLWSKVHRHITIQGG
jgi:ABC-2 type transport system permease protein